MSGLYEEIVQTFRLTGSVKDTAEIVGASRVKVQKVLITEQLWSSNSSEQIGLLFRAGVSAPEIAHRLGVTMKNVHAYLPYTKGEYGAVESRNSIRCKRYRERAEAVSALSEDTSDEAFWKVVALYQAYPFYTDHGVRFDYTVTEEGIVFKYGERERSFTRGLVTEEYHKALVKDEWKSDVLEKSRSSETLFLYALFCKWGIIPGMVRG